MMTKAARDFQLEQVMALVTTACKPCVTRETNIGVG